MHLLIKHIQSQSLCILSVLCLGAIGQISLLIEPVILRYSIDHFLIITSLIKSGSNLKILLALSIVIFLFTLPKFLKSYEQYYSNIIAQRIGIKMYTLGLSHVLRLSYLDISNNRTGTVIYKLQKAKRELEHAILASFEIFSGVIVSVLFVIIYLLTISPIIALLFLLGLSSIVIFSTFINDQIEKLHKNISKKKSILSADTVESIKNIEIIKSLGLEKQELRRLDSTNETLIKLEISRIRKTRLYSFIQGTVFNILRVSTIGAVIYLIYLQELSLGEFFSIYLFAIILLAPIRKIGPTILQLSEARISLKEISNLLKIKPEEDKITNCVSGPINNIQCNNVSFSYIGNSTKTVKNISLQVSKGETIGIVGPTGAGKSTLVKLLVGLLTPDDGSILYNDQNLKELVLNDIRSQIGLVSQNTKLFSGTIRENLLYINPSASDEDCITALSTSGFLSLMKNSTLNLDTTIGEAGLKLSSGERQKLEIAKALIRKPQLLIFDEATSSLDPLSESSLTLTIKDLSSCSSRITIIISHRLSTIMHANQIYVLERGQIVEIGKHNELIKKQGLYFAMWEQQHYT